MSTADVGPIEDDSTDEQIAVALEWVRARVADFARLHPQQVKELARERRHMQIASGR